MPEQFIQITADSSSLPSLEFILAHLQSTRAEWLRAHASGQRTLGMIDMGSLDRLDEAVRDLQVLIGDIRLAAYGKARAAKKRSTHAS